MRKRGVAMKRHLVALAVIGALVASACSSGGGVSTATATATVAGASPTKAAPTMMSVAYSSVSGDKLPIFVADEAGIFTANNLIVHSSNADRSPQALASLP